MHKITNQNHNMDNTLKLAVNDFKEKNPVEVAWKSKCVFDNKKQVFPLFCSNI